MSGLPSRRTPTKRLRNQIVLRDLRTCRYCEKYLSKDKEITIDHIVPFAKGGPTVLTNLVVACVECNKKKSCKSLEESGMTVIPIRYLKNKYQRRFYPASHWTRWEYDPNTKILYLHIRYGPLFSITNSRMFENNLLTVDEHKDAPNNIVGIEVINPDRRWGLERILSDPTYNFSDQEKEYIRWIRDAKPWHEGP